MVLHRYGTPLERFWNNVQKTDTCWLWTGRVNNRGYGVLIANNRPVLAHRFAYELANGPLSAKLDCCHHCDTPRCVRNDGQNSHLFAGTRAENMQDMLAKKRNYHHTNPERVARGSGVDNARLNDSAVREIRRLAGTVTQRELATRLGVSQRAVFFVIHGQTWRHVQ